MSGNIDTLAYVLTTLIKDLTNGNRVIVVEKVDGQTQIGIRRTLND